MSFTNYPYNRPDVEVISAELKRLSKAFRVADAVDTQVDILKQANTITNSYSTMLNLCLIRHTINTEDKFYESENSFFDQKGPEFEAARNELYKALQSSRFKQQLIEKFGQQLFTIAESSLKAFSPEIIENLKRENELSTKYTKLKATAKIEFDGKVLNLSTITPYRESQDRNVRKAACEATWKFYEEQHQPMADLFDDLIKERSAMANRLGYKSFIDLAYLRLNRSGYTPAMIKAFRESIRKHVVPLATQLYERQAKRLGLDSLKYWDEDFSFKTGNPKPQGEPEWIVKQAKKMYTDLSDETADFFGFMEKEGLMDLKAREGKATGGYCTYISNHRAPFIFSNFNGTSGDIDVLTHEAGHAFQIYSSRDVELCEYYWPTFEACEVHSMSMEFFTWPWMNLFFNGDLEKYRFSHLESAIKFLPYGAAVDEFQHEVFEHPDWSQAEREACWSRIEQIYLPHRDNGDIDMLKNGCLWYGQNHIFVSPFYYIDYVLAQICAFQYWEWDKKDHKVAWQSYIKLCKQGGSRPFLELLKIAGLDSPFDEKIVEKVTSGAACWLEQIDDTKF